MEADLRDAGVATPSLEMASAAMSAISNAVVITGTDGVIGWVNPAFTRMSGYPAEEVVGKTPKVLRSGVQDERFYSWLWSTILEGRIWQGELVNRHRDGHLYTVRQTITPLVDDDGNITHFVAVHEDVTELREGQARLRALFDHALDAVVFFDDDGTCIDANPVACDLAGRDLHELAEIPVSELLPGADWERQWPEFHDGRRRTGTCRVQRADGSAADVEIQVVANVLPGMHVALLRDVTAQRRLEAERDLQAQLVEAAGTAVAATTLDGTVIFWNSAAERLLGWSRDEVLGRPILEIGVLPRARADVREILRRVRSGRSWTGEFEMWRKDGTNFPALLTDAPYVDADGEIAGIISVSTDITDLRRAEEELQETVDRLARSEEIRVAFLRATSHELRTPLAALAGFAETLEEREDQLGPEQRRHILSRLRANTGRLSRLIEDLLDVDRLASGLVTANREPHDLRELVHRVIDGQPLAGRHLDVDLQPITAAVDPAKLERVVANLLANAVRHTPAGARVRIELGRADAATVLAVEDDGPGVDPTYLDQIFEPFVQAPAQHDAAQPGTGLGLTLTREFVTLHGGSITATNRPQGGIRFEVVLPDHPAHSDHPGLSAG